ncbi:hypothetical protein ABMA28_002748 [Loxostege sticticalis]|uniref:Moricin n=1 Tax=Loxostege sticticalis TaxID=481309 RepID=A0ABD0SZ51_LOXSC
MKFTGLFMLVVAVLALFVGAGHASPEPKVPIRKIGKVVKTGFGVLSAAGTAHEVYNHIRNRG